MYVKYFVVGMLHNKSLLQYTIYLLKRIEYTIT